MSVFTRGPVPMLFFFMLATLAAAQQWTTTPFNAPALPLAVRSPYLNAWLAQGPNPPANGDVWPQLWTLNHIVGWSAFVQVDNQTYAILGDAPVTHVANETAAEFTATRTSFLFKAGPVNVNATFLSPIEPTDLVRQSMPFSYFYVDITSADGQAHSVQVYSDISAEWVTGDNSLIANWTQNTAGNFISLQTQLVAPTPFAEIGDSPQDAVAYYSMSTQSGTSWQIGQDIVVRGQFNTSGTLKNQADTSFRAVSNDWPVFAISVDLGSTTGTSSPIIWALGLIRDPVIQYTAENSQTELRSAYYWSQYSTAEDVVEFFLGDFNRSLSAAVALDTKIQNDGLQYSSQYADLLALSVRQVLASTDITIVKGTNGSWNTSDVKSFMKNMGSTTGTSGANTVDVLYAAFPVYLYLNASLGGYLLAPLLEYQETNLYTNVYAARDLGTYPNATGDNGAHNLGIEESANMLIMTLAHAQASGDGTLISKHYNLLHQWADYLVNNTLSPNTQVTADNIDATNQTNLAIKGIIGIGAMAEISQLASNSADNSKYKGISTSYVQQWQTLAMSSDGSHLLADYGVQSSSGLIYNLYADKLLQLNLVPQSVYQTQSTFYSTEAAQSNLGTPFDSSSATKSRTDWSLLTAGSISDANTRNLFVSQVHNYVVAGLSSKPFAVIYDTSASSVLGGANSPAQGAMFSFLALNQTIKSVNVPNVASTSNSSTTNKTPVGAIAGGVVGGVVVIGAALIFLVLFMRRRRPGEISTNEKGSIDSSPRAAIFSPGTTYEHFSVTPNSDSRPELSPTSPGIYPNDAYSQQQDGAANPRYSESYFRQRGASMSDIGPSASQVQGPTSTVVTSETSRAHGSQSRVMMAKQTLVNEELRSEVENLRLEMERIRLERGLGMPAMTVLEAPPSYSHEAV